jgi:hypothetical protein
MDVAKIRRTLWVAIAGRHDPRTGATLRRGAIAAMDTRTGRLRVLRPPIDPTELAVGFGSLWVLGAPIKRGPRGVLRIDPRTGRVIAAIQSAQHSYGSRIAATPRAVWVGGADVYPRG